MITLIRHAGGRTEQVDALDAAWLDPRSGVTFWMDLAKPSPDEARVLRDVFKFHELAIEDALSEVHHPKVEAYDGFLYLILHGIDFQAARHRFATRDTDFFVGPNYLVTVHDGQTRTIDEMRALCQRNAHILAEGPAALLHRIVDTMVEHYRPEVEKLQAKLDALEKEVFEHPRQNFIKVILTLKRDVVSLRRVTLPQRDVVNRLARREFPLIDEQVVYRFRDVYDQLVRLSDEALFFQDRITGLLEAHMSNVSNRLNAVMKVLTVIATIFMPLTVLTGLYGMNVHLPAFPGGEAAQFWWILAVMVGVTTAMVWVFHFFKWL